MKTQTSLLYLWLAVLSAPISAQTATTAFAFEVQGAKPLNLSLPKEDLRSRASPLLPGATDDPAARNLQPDTGRLPYGSGYEVRQRGGHAPASTAENYGRGGRGDGRSSTRGGNGGMGRGR
jgi:hypothetical protein